MTTDLDSDYDTIENRRKLRRIIGGLVYDTETASVLFRHEQITRPEVFWGEALYINVYNKLFLHRYHQWDRFNGITPLTVPEAIAWLEKYCPSMIEGFFGKLPEAGQGEPYTPVETS